MNREGVLFDTVHGWEIVKLWLEDSLQVTSEVMHIHLGLIAFVIGSLLWRGRLGGWAPLLFVLAIELLNELSDYGRYVLSGWPWRPGPTVMDIAQTMLWPLILTLLARRHLAASTVDRSST